MRDAYAAAAEKHGIPWSGRTYNRQDWQDSTPVNRALSAANACLYGVCHAAIVALGYSPGLGFVHTGKQLSFVYDIADLYKTEYTIPIAFEATAQEKEARFEHVAPKERVTIEGRVRHRLRIFFHQTKLLERLPKDIARVLDIPLDQATEEDPYANDPANPAPLWNPTTGGRNRIIDLGDAQP